MFYADHHLSGLAIDANSPFLRAEGIEDSPAAKPLAERHAAWAAQFARRRGGVVGLAAGEGSGNPHRLARQLRGMHRQARTRRPYSTAPMKPERRAKRGTGFWRSFDPP
jgi:hypothetical protein